MSLITSLVGGLPLGTVTFGLVPSCAAPVGCAGAVPVAVEVPGGAAAVDTVELSLPPPPQPASRMAQATEMSAARRTAAHPSAVRGPAHAVLASARSGRTAGGRTRTDELSLTRKTRSRAVPAKPCVSSPRSILQPRNTAFVPARSAYGGGCTWFARAYSNHVSTRPGRSVASHGESSSHNASCEGAVRGAHPRLVRTRPPLVAVGEKEDHQ